MSEEKTATTDAPRKKLTYKDIKKRKKPAVETVPIALDHEKADEFNKAYAEVQQLRDLAAERPRDKELQATLAEVEAQFEELRRESEEFVVDFVFRSIGRQKFEDLVEECPPTEKQKKEAKKKGEEEPGWNPETFPVRLMAEAIVEPELTEDEVFEIWDSEDWNQAELMSLFIAALTVNQQRKIVDLGKGSGPTGDSAKS